VAGILASKPCSAEVADGGLTTPQPKERKKGRERKLSHDCFPTDRQFLINFSIVS
jgi:hypothetical protein